MTGKRPPRTILALLLLILLPSLPFLLRKRGSSPMSPAVDLRRLVFPTSGVTVDEHGAEHVVIVTDEWMLSLDAVDSEAAWNIESALRSIPTWAPKCQLDVLKAPGGPSILRLLRGVEGPNRAVQYQFVISFGGGWAHGGAYSRLLEPFDAAPIDKILLSMSLADEPRTGVEVLPAWLAYQQSRAAGSPIAKFVLFMAPAPVRIGDERVDSGSLGARSRTPSFKLKGRPDLPRASSSSTRRTTRSFLDPPSTLARTAARSRRA